MHARLLMVCYPCVATTGHYGTRNLSFVATGNFEYNNVTWRVHNSTSGQALLAGEVVRPKGVCCSRSLAKFLQRRGTRKLLCLEDSFHPKVAGLKVNSIKAER